MKKNKLLSTLSNCNLDITYNYISSKDNEIFKLNQIFTDVFSEEIKLFFQDKGFDEYKIIESWFQIEKNCMNIDIHNCGYGISALCFIEYNSETQFPIQFLSPFNNIIDGTSQYYTPEVYEGSIIFFPSCVNHYTLPNFDEKDKITATFNISVR